VLVDKKGVKSGIVREIARKIGEIARNIGEMRG
jgi:hypothetical protein